MTADETPARGGDDPRSPLSLTFLGTGNFHAPGRYWNSFLVDGHILVEPSPAVLPNLRRAGVDPRAIDVIFISHFHADHTFGWPFLLLSYLGVDRRDRDLWVVGPPGVRAYLETMLRAGAIDHIVAAMRTQNGGFPLRYVEVSGDAQQAGSVPFCAVRVEHDPALECFGYLIERAGRTLGYTGDARFGDGVRRIAAGADVLVADCNEAEPRTPVHMSLADIRTLRAEFPALPIVLTHLGPDVDAAGLPGVLVPNDLETITL